jgi:hypothetical protein
LLALDEAHENESIGIHGMDARELRRLPLFRIPEVSFEALKQHQAESSATDSEEYDFMSDCECDDHDESSFETGANIPLCSENMAV